MLRPRRALSPFLLLLVRSALATSTDQKKSLHQILENVRQITWTDPSSGVNNTLAVTLPCSYVNDDYSLPAIQESTTTLLAAKALSKTFLPSASVGLDSLDDLAWDVLDAALFPYKDQPDNAGYFVSQGLLPKYWYFPSPYQTESHEDYYLPGTRFPHWSLFLPMDEFKSFNHPYLQSSQRLSALPLHASILWDMLLAVIPPQRRTDDDTDDALDGSYNFNYDQNKEWWDRMQKYYEQIYQNHLYLHEVVMRGCTAATEVTVPCYNILHPWESLMDPASSAWEQALQSTMDAIDKEQWRIPFQAPRLVRESYDFPADEVYSAMMYLFLEGWNKVNITESCPDNDNICTEDVLRNQTQFAVLDVGYAAILSQADADLEQLGRVLRQVMPDSNGRRDQQLQQLQDWQEDNARIVQELLWNPAYYTYMSKYYSVETGKMEWLDAAVSNNLMPFWNVAAGIEDNQSGKNNNNQANTKSKTVTEEDIKREELAREHIQVLSLQLLRREGEYSFDCGLYPIWSHGGCQRMENSTILQPIVNYLIATGLIRSSATETFGQYIWGQSLELLSYDFGEAYRAKSPYDNLAKLDSCGSSSTLTAAIAYNFLVPDPPHTNRLPLTPIRRKWVITLITIELLVAFSIGVSCLVLSFNLVRKLRDYSPVPLEDEEFDDYDSYNDEAEDYGSPPTQQNYDSTGNSDLQPQPATDEGQSLFSSIGLN